MKLWEVGNNCIILCMFCLIRSMEFSGKKGYTLDVKNKTLTKQSVLSRKEIRL